MRNPLFVKFVIKHLGEFACKTIKVFFVIFVLLFLFRQKQLLKRHQNLYHNPNYIPPPPQEKTHACPECDRSFRHKGNLIRHMALHDPDSSVQEKALQLKMGRQKKLQIMEDQTQSVIFFYMLQSFTYLNLIFIILSLA